MSIQEQHQMKQVPGDQRKPTSAQTLLWCCFCDAHFRKPSQLSRHLDRYSVNWALYWQLFNANESGLSCTSCNIPYGDRGSLECHFKMVHCISGRPCARREPHPVVNVRERDTERRMGQFLRDSDEVHHVVSERDDAETGHRESNTDVSEKTRYTNLDDVDVLFEISRPDSPDVEVPPRGISDSADGCTKPFSGVTKAAHLLDDDHILHGDKPHSFPHATGDMEPNVRAIVPDGLDATLSTGTSSKLAFLSPDDEVVGLDAFELAIVSPAGTELESYRDTTLQLPQQENRDGNGALAPKPRRAFGGSDVLVVTPAVTLPTEAGHDRSTAVVNPFGSHENERLPGCSRISSAQCRREAHLSTTRNVDVVSASFHQHEFENETRGQEERLAGKESPPGHFAELGTLSATSWLQSRHETLSLGQLCNVPFRSQAGATGGREVNALPHEVSSGISQESMSVLSRLTPSKIAAIMNRDVLPRGVHPCVMRRTGDNPVACGPEAADHFSATRLQLPPNFSESVVQVSRGNAVLDVEIKAERVPESLDPEQLGDDDDTAGEVKWSASFSDSADEERGSLPDGFSIVNVESLISTLDSDSSQHGLLPSGRAAVNEHTKSDFSNSAYKRTRQRTSYSKKVSRDCGGRANNILRGKGKRQGRRRGGRTSSAMRQGAPEEKVPAGEDEIRERISLDVFKQPIWQCVGVVHPGSVVEVSVGTELRTLKNCDSLDGMVMKVDETQRTVRYYVHFPNVDTRYDCWVTRDDIIQVYRTGGTTESGVSAPADVRGAKRRLSFDPAAEEETTKRVKAAASPGAVSEVAVAMSSPATGRSARSSHRWVMGAAQAAAPPPTRASRPRRTANPPHRSPAEGGTSQAADSVELTEADQEGVSGVVARAQVETQSPQTTPATPRTTMRRPRKKPLQKPETCFSSDQVNDGRAKCSDEVSAARKDVPKVRSAAKEETRGAVSTSEAPEDRGSEAVSYASVSPRDVREFRNEDCVGRSSRRPRRPAATLGRSTASSESVVEGEPNQKEVSTELRLEIVSVDVGHPSAEVSSLAEETETGASDSAGVAPTAVAKAVPLVRGRPRRRPPKGVVAVPADKSLLDSLSPGSLVYVACRTEPNGWRRLYAAEIIRIDKGLFHTRYRVRYVGFGSKYNEWIADEVIHSRLDKTDSAITCRTLRKGYWIAPPADVTSSAGPEGPPEGAKVPLITLKGPPNGRKGPVPRRGAVRAEPVVPHAQLKPPLLKHEGPSEASSTGPEGLPADRSWLSRLRASSAGPLMTHTVPEVLCDQVLPPSGFSSDPPPANKTGTLWGMSESREAAAAAGLREPAQAPRLPGSTKPSRPQTCNRGYRPRGPKRVLGHRVTRVRRPLRRPTRVLGSRDNPTCVTGRRGGLTPIRGPPGGPTPFLGPRVDVARLRRAQEPHQRRAPGRVAVGSGRAGVRRVRHTILSSKEQVRPPARLSVTSAPAEAACRGRAAVPSVQDTPPPPLLAAWSVAGGRTTELSTDVSEGSARKHLRKARGASATPPLLLPVEPLLSAGVAAAPTRRPRRPRSQPPAPESGATTAATRRSGRPPRSGPAPAAGALSAEAAAERRRPGTRSGGSAAVAARPGRRLPRPEILCSPPAELPEPVPAAARRSSPDSSSDVRAELAAATLPPSPAALAALKPGDYAYVVYEVTHNGTKIVYPAKMIKVNKDLHCVRYFVHYLGWKHRYNEWVAAEVIHSIVEVSQLQRGIRSLQRLLVPPPSPALALPAHRRPRPCSVDLSANNICFFSALRKERFHVDDRRIMALRAAARSRGGPGAASTAGPAL